MVTFDAIAMASCVTTPCPELWAAVSIDGLQGRKELTLSNEPGGTASGAYDDGLIIYLNSFEPIENTYKIEFTLLCDEKCQGIINGGYNGVDVLPSQAGGIPIGYENECVPQYKQCVGKGIPSETCQQFLVSCQDYIKECEMTYKKCLELADEYKERTQQICEEEYKQCVAVGIRPIVEDSIIQALPLGEGKCDQGCYVDSDVKKCVPVGTRMSVKGAPMYCDVDGAVYQQKKDGDSAENDYECRSNSARYSVCENVAEQVGILQKMFGWLGRLFGQDERT